MTDEEIGVWFCPLCSEAELNGSNMNNKNEDDDFNLSLSLATELGSAILQENENLKQELHEVKNQKSTYELELEDKIQQIEEEMKIILKTHSDKANEMDVTIKSLERKLKMEKQLREELITQVEQEKTLLP
ncbi:hypothetical protein J6590_078983 [Homalodisca vitripennis]|nr:hypothetical protein J6590_078983 [Homalodisca vitripennis]